MRSFPNNYLCKVLLFNLPGFKNEKLDGQIKMQKLSFQQNDKNQITVFYSRFNLL